MKCTISAHVPYYVCLDGRTSSTSEYLSREKRQLEKKLIQEILCPLEQVNLDQLLERVKADFSCLACKSEVFKDFVHTLLLEYVALVRRCQS